MTFDIFFRFMVLPVVLTLASIGLVGSVWITARDIVRELRGRGC